MHIGGDHGRVESNQGRGSEYLRSEEFLGGKMKCVRAR